MIINGIKVERSELNIEITIKDESFAGNGVEMVRKKLKIKEKNRKVNKVYIKLQYPYQESKGSEDYRLKISF